MEPVLEEEHDAREYDGVELEMVVDGIIRRGGGDVENLCGLG